MARHFLGVTFRETAIDLFYVGILGITLIAGTSSWRGLVSVRIFQFLGKISYGLYLIHMLIFELVAQFTARYLPKFLPSAGHFYLILLQFCVAGSLALMVASISRRYFEEPFLRMKNRADRRTKAWSITGEHTNAQSLEIVAS